MAPCHFRRRWQKTRTRARTCIDADVDIMHVDNCRSLIADWCWFNTVADASTTPLPHRNPMSQPVMLWSCTPTFILLPTYITSIVIRHCSFISFVIAARYWVIKLTQVLTASSNKDRLCTCHRVGLTDFNCGRTGKTTILVHPPTCQILVKFGSALTVSIITGHISSLNHYISTSLSQ